MRYDLLDPPTPVSPLPVPRLSPDVPRPRVASLLALTAAVALSMSCSGDSATAPVPAAHIVFAASADSITLGDSVTISPSFTDAQNRPVTAGPPLSWTSSDTTVVRMTGAVAHALRLGSAQVTASGGGLTGSVSVVVRPVPVKTIVAPAGDRSLLEGDTLTAAPGLILIDQHGDTVTGRTVVYTSTNTSVVTVDATSGVMHGVAPGTAAILLHTDTASLTLRVTVTPAPVAKLQVIPSTVYVPPGRSWTLTPTVLAASGTTLNGRTVTYVSSNPSVAAVSAAGVVTGGQSGATTIAATTGGVTTQVPVTVAPPGPGAFSIVVRGYGTVDPQVLSAAKDAAARWARAVSAPLIPYPVVGSEADTAVCGPGVPAVHDTVANVLILITTDSIDGRGKIAGQGGPCIIRNDAPQTTVVGTIEIDRADVADAASAGILTDLLEHEMGHVLGIGSLWGTSAYPGTATGLGGSDPRFTGAMARGASAELGFTPDSSQGVPVENTGGAGTRDSHWRASVFGRELMTGTLHNDANPLSLVSIRALQDLGYGVAPTAAAAFSATNAFTGTIAAQRNALTASRSYQIDDVVLRPRFRVTRTGRLRPIRGAPGPGALPRPR